jgi:CxxC motif-containing protein (DUF1111 family)
MRLLVTGLLTAGVLISCEKLAPSAPADDSLLDGPIEGLDYPQRQQFLRGDIAFNDDIFTVTTGLGPLFVTNSCGSCHAGDGKGHPFSTLTRYGQTDSTGNHFLHLGGPQLQHRALPGYTPEQIPSGATFSRFTPPAVTGLGFLTHVTDTDILAMADPQDADGNGISGVPNWIHVPDYIKLRSGAVSQGGKWIGRFGKKAATYDLLHQTISAYTEDMGIASVFNPIDTWSQLEIDPEVALSTVHDVVFYLTTLKAPIPRDQDDPLVQSGKELFLEIGCADCHRPTLKTGYSSIAALSEKEFHPYTDMLLHDMGPALDDGYTEGHAKSSEWRTPPLWGLGLAPQSQGGQYFLMHDGRAQSIGEAILLHGGEAENAKARYINLTMAEMESLLTFLESL